MASVFLCVRALAETQDIDKELSDLADKLAGPIKSQGKKKVTVLDFTDLHGSSSELGKYIAEQLTVNLVLGKRDFSVLDRANLKSILAEHKLTATGLVDPENAKKLGMFAGVDALILGTITHKDQKIGLTAKIITTDTAEIVGAARAEFKPDETVKQLESRSTENTGKDILGGDKKDEIVITKSFGDLRVELQPLHIVNGNEFILTMSVTNRNSKKSTWLALNTGGGFPPLLKRVVIDSDGSEFLPDMNSISGIEFSSYDSRYIVRATEIRPTDSMSTSIKFFSRAGKKPVPGSCRLQLEFLFSNDFHGNVGTARLQNFVTKIDAQ